MNKFQISAGLVLILGALLIACDDFFAPTIEIFNEVQTPVNIEQKHKQEQKKKQKQTNINQQNIN